jgi:hypothetical protein
MAEKNVDLPGVEGEGVSPKKVKAIDEAFDELISAREKRMAYGEKEGEASATLVSLFHKHKIRCYVFDDKKYKLSAIEKVKVAREEKEVEAESEE